jgi:hypothetical protein
MFTEEIPDPTVARRPSLDDMPKPQPQFQQFQQFQQEQQTQQPFINPITLAPTPDPFKTGFVPTPEKSINAHVVEELNRKELEKRKGRKLDPREEAAETIKEIERAKLHEKLMVADIDFISRDNTQYITSAESMAKRRKIVKNIRTKYRGNKVDEEPRDDPVTHVSALKHTDYTFNDNYKFTSEDEFIKEVKEEI